MSKTKKYDTIVVGGGSAGVAAAVGARQLGKKVALVERTATLGGKATASYVGTICGHFLQNKSQETIPLCSGFPHEFVTTMQKRSKSTILTGPEGIKYLPYDHFVFEHHCEEVIQDHAIDLYLLSSIYEVTSNDNKIESLHLLNHENRISLQADAFVDCTGGVLLSNLCNIDTIQSDRYQASAKVFGIEGVKNTNPDNLKLVLFRALRKGIQDQEISEHLKHLSIVPGSIKGNQIYLKIGLPEVVTNDENQLSNLNIQANLYISQIFNYLKGNIEIFGNSHLGHIPVEVGVRIGRRNLGKVTLPKESVLSTAKTKDHIAKACWPIEYWDYGQKPRMEYLPENDFYHIPFGCIQSYKIDNLYFGGRNISADDDAIASARVIGTCLQTGFAAGIAASARNKDEAIRIIQKKLAI